jgi:hypothetical protein
MPRALRFQTSHASWGGLQCCHVSYGSGPSLSAEVGSDAATYPTGPYGPRDSSIKKSLADLPVQLGTHAPNAHAHVSKVPHIRVIMRLQDVQTDSVVNTCKACRHVSIVRLQYDASSMDHSSGPL